MEIPGQLGLVYYLGPEIACLWGSSISLDSILQVFCQLPYAHGTIHYIKLVHDVAVAINAITDEGCCITRLPVGGETRLFRVNWQD